MSVGKNLNEMENIEENQVTKGAASAEAMPKLTTGGTPATWEDLGGPTPENSRPDDDSNKLKTPGATLSQVKDVVNSKAGAAEAVSDEVEEGQEVVSEDETTTDEVVAEEESSTEEIVAEEETTEEEVIEEEETYDVDADVQALLEGEELSEEFQDKARTIFETAIKSKVADIKEELNESYANALVEELDTIKKGLTERVDSYLEYVADEWLQENKLAVENGLKTEMTESFLEGMKSLFEEHYVTIPEEKYDVLESMVEKLDDMETKLNEQIEKNVSLNSRLGESVANGILESVSEGLASTQKEKLASLSESVEFESEESYREKLETLRESYFSSKAKSPAAKSDTISEGVDNAEGVGSPTGSMAAYMKTLSAFGKS